MFGRGGGVDACSCRLFRTELMGFEASGGCWGICATAGGGTGAGVAGSVTGVGCSTGATGFGGVMDGVGGVG